jgi:hypothetical protein
VTGSRRGSREAVHFLYVRYAPEVHSGVRELVPDEREAQAITESVFGDLVDLVDGYEPRREPFAAWLVGVARELAAERSQGRPFRRSSYSRPPSRIALGLSQPQ